jgi:hypothetical protein
LWRSSRKLLLDSRKAHPIRTPSLPDGGFSKHERVYAVSILVIVIIALGIELGQVLLPSKYPDKPPAHAPWSLPSG